MCAQCSILLHVKYLHLYNVDLCLAVGWDSAKSKGTSSSESKWRKFLYFQVLDNFFIEKNCRFLGRILDMIFFLTVMISSKCDFWKKELKQVLFLNLFLVVFGLILWSSCWKQRYWSLIIFVTEQVKRDIERNILCDCFKSLCCLRFYIFSFINSLVLGLWILLIIWWLV